MKLSASISRSSSAFPPLNMSAMKRVLPLKMTQSDKRLNVKQSMSGVQVYGLHMRTTL